MGQSSVPRRPNLVYVFADQLRYFLGGYAGDEYGADLKVLDSLRQQGCNFTRRSRRPGMRSVSRVADDREVSVQHRHGDQ